MQATETVTELKIVRRPPSVIQAFRMTQGERSQLCDYAKQHDAKISDVVRSALAQVGVLRVG